MSNVFASSANFDKSLQPEQHIAGLLLRTRNYFVSLFDSFFVIGFEQESFQALFQSFDITDLVEDDS